MSGRSAARLAARLGDEAVIFETDSDRAEALRADGFEVFSGPWSPS
ncbi:MAG: hypothetical protein OEY55_15875, partial [Acidimicrobiia bacterium]|nr:hypothetical protein [Acidimicrobiia bacterium]